MDMLGLGVRLNFDDNMSSQINPLIRDLERLRNAATKTTQSFNNMSGAHNPFGGQRQRDLNDYYASIQRTDLALLSISDRLIRATTSAQNLSNAVNRMQFTGAFNQMYSDINRVQRMLGNMGYGMSQMQRDMANNRAFNMLNYQMKDLQDRIKLTSQAIREMELSPDSGKYAKEIDLARKSLQAYQLQMQSMGSMQQKLADTHGLGLTQSGGKDVLYEKANTVSESVANRLLGASMMDMAIASNLAYSSLDKTGKMMVGLGYTTMEARQKLTQLLGTMQAVGMGLTQFLSMPLLIATTGIGVFANKFEQAYNKFQARTLTATSQMGEYRNAMGEVWADTPNAEWGEMGQLFASIQNSYGKLPIGQMKEFASVGLNFKSAWEIDSFESLNKSLEISKKYAVDNATGYDLLALALKGTNGNLEEVDGWLNKNISSLNMTSKEVKNAYETLEEANGNGAIQKLIAGVKEFGNVLRLIWDSGLGQFVGAVGDAIGKVSNFTYELLKANPMLAKFAGFLMGGLLAFGIMIGPIAVATAFLIRFRNVIQGTALAVAGFNKGGFALLPPQAKMAMNSVKALTVAFARFPQTLIAGALPALYTFLRQLPMIAVNILKLNPLMTALTFGAIAYSQNWMGIGDKINSVVKGIVNGWTEAKELVSKGMGNEAFDISQFSGMTQVFAKMQGTALIAKKVLTSIFGGTELKFETGEINLMQQLGIEGFVNTIAKTGKAVKDFWDGFKSGVEEVFGAVKTFAGWMYDTFKPVFDWLLDTVVDIADAVSKAFGGDGVKSIKDITGSAEHFSKTMFDLGKIAGVALTAFLGYKLLKPIFSMFKNPFAGFITSAKRATDAVKVMSGAIKQLPTNALNNLGSNPTANRAGATTIAGGGMNTGTLSNRQRRRLTAQQESTYGRRLTNLNAQARGHDMGTAVHGKDGQRYGSTMYARNQSTLSRALFGQRYDTFDEQGRRRTREVRGGLLNRDRTNLQGGVSMRDRVIDGRQRVAQQARTLGSNIRTSAQNAGSFLANSSAGQRVASAGRAVGNVGSKAMKPVSVPVKWVMGRLQTAGVIRQGSQAGTQSGSRFKRMFNLASKGLGGGATMFRNVVSGAGTAGGKAGRGMLKGFGFVGKGITGIFKLGLRAIPFLGWALMAWDIISAIFTNWDAIVSGAKKAWAWIKDDGVKALTEAWEWVKTKAGEVWNWILTDGVRMAGEIGVAVTNFIGQALTWIVTKAIEVFAWILTDGIAMAVSLGANILTTVGQAFTDLVSWALGKFGEIVGAVWEIGSTIGSNIFEGIKSGFGDIASWFGGKLSSAWDTVKGWFGGGGKDGDKATKHARGGIINAPHLGIVGEAGPEAIIPLSGNQRNRAQHLLTHTAGILGMTVQQKDTGDANSDIQDIPTKTKTNLKQNIVRTSKQSSVNQAGGSGGQDNSVTINNVHINLPQGVQADANGGRKVAQSLAKELQKLMKQEKMRSNGKNLTLEDLILNM